MERTRTGAVCDGFSCARPPFLHTKVTHEVLARALAVSADAL